MEKITSRFMFTIVMTLVQASGVLSLVQLGNEHLSTGLWGTLRPLFKPTRNKKLPQGNIANLSIRDNVCIGLGDGILSEEGETKCCGPSERSAVQALLSMEPIPNNYSGPIVPGTIVVLTMHHYNSYYWANVEHLAEAMLPVYDALSRLHDGGLITPMPIKGVLLHQATKDHEALKHTDWFINFAKLMGKDFHKTQVFYQEDIMRHQPSDQNPLCVQRVVLLNRRLSTAGYMERHFFSHVHSAQKFRAHAFQALELPKALRNRRQGRKSALILRNDSQGIGNQDAIAEQLKAYLEKRCWSFQVIQPFAQPMRLKEQVEQFADIDLSISVHGAHLTNLLWQPGGSGVLIIEKCGFHDRDFSQLANESGLAVYRSRNASCPKNPLSLGALQMHVQAESQRRHLRAGTELRELHQVYEPVFETDLKPALDEALKDLESRAHRGKPCAGLL